MSRLDGRVALVTGAGKGMGRSHALLLAERGARVVVHDVDAAAADDAAGAVGALGGEPPVVIVSDVADVPATADAIRRAEDEAGRIDILVNNAGIAGGDATTETIDEALFDRMFAVHVKGAFFAGRAVIPGMKARRYGKIVNIGSVAGMGAVGLRPHYCAAKGALMTLTKTWAREFAAWNICVNCVAPGWVLTPMVLEHYDEDTRRRHAQANIPLGRYADPREVSALVAWLCSAEADFVTGQTVSPNGGQVIAGA